MTVKRCLKCGAEIPEGAQFCPSCGAPKGTEAIREEAMEPTNTPPPNPPQPQQPQQPVYQQPPQKMGNPLEDMAKTFFSTKMIIIALCIGVLVLLASAGISSFVQPKKVWDDDVILHAAGFLQSMALYGIGLILIGGGIVNRHLDKYFRLGLIIAGALILG